MEHQEAFRTVMVGQFQAARLRNPNFSLRAFSKRVGLSSSAVSEIFSGKRRVSRKLAERVLMTLQQEPEVIQQVMSAFDKVEKSKPGTELYYKTLAIETYAVISEWHHYAILNLTETSDFVSEAGWIANRLGLQTSVVEGAVNRLVALGLLKWEQGRLSRTEKRLSSTDDVASIAVKKAHKSDFQMITEVIDRVDVANRDFTSMTFPVNLSRLPQAKKIVRRFLDEIADCLETGEKTEVFKLNVALYPLTQIEKNEEA